MYLELVYLEGQVGHAGGQVAVDALFILPTRLESQQGFALLDPELVRCNSVPFLDYFDVVVALLG